MKKPLLLPKEHGAYAQLGFPLATGLALAGFSPAAMALGASAFFLFLANEPLAILLGVRGPRLRQKLEKPARVRGGVLVGAGFVLGAVGLFMGWPELWPEFLLPALAGLALIPAVLAGKQKSLSGEFLVLTAFSTLVLPMAAASGASPWRAAPAAAVWWMSFALATLEVHAIKARVKKTARSQWTRWASPMASALVVACALSVALGQWGPPRWAGPSAALLPPALAVFALSLLTVHPRHLKRVGWTLVAANALTLVLLLQG